MESKKNWTDFIVNLIVFVVIGSLVLYGVVSCGIKTFERLTSVKVHNLEDFSFYTNNDTIKLAAFSIEQTDQYLEVSFDVKNCPGGLSSLKEASCTMTIDSESYTDSIELEESDSGYMFVFFNFVSDNIPIEPRSIDFDISIQGDEEYNILASVKEAEYSISYRDPES